VLVLGRAFTGLGHTLTMVGGLTAILKDDSAAFVAMVAPAGLELDHKKLTIDELKAAIDHADGKPALVLVNRQGRSIFLTLRPTA